MTMNANARTMNAGRAARAGEQQQENPHKTASEVMRAKGEEMGVRF